MATINITMSGISMESPLVLASGILGTTASSMRMVAQHGAGAVTSKSISKDARKGHPAPCILPFDHGIINAVGLSNPGMELATDEIQTYKEICSTPIIASIFGASLDEFAEVAKTVAQAQPDMIEVNVSCPNVESEFGRPFGADFDACSKITRLVKDAAGSIPVSMKLTVNCPSIGRMARVCEDNGADIITAINTVGPGMLIDTTLKKPILSNKAGGISGPCIHPIALKAVFDIYKEVKIPIIATGGVSSADDGLQMIMAGATAVAIGSGVYYCNVEIFNTINQGMEKYLKENGYTSLAEIRGAAHE